jgi:hypothetical protein
MSIKHIPMMTNNVKSMNKILCIVYFSMIGPPGKIHAGQIPIDGNLIIKVFDEKRVKFPSMGSVLPCSGSFILM